MPVSVETYVAVALEDPEGQWELYRGRLRAKPGGSFRHNDVTCRVGFDLGKRLDRLRFHVRINSGRLKQTDENFLVPDVFVFPTAIVGPDRDRPDTLEVYDVPVTLVVEVWSPVTESYDVDQTLRVYQRRGDEEIWRLHPFERTLTVWRRVSEGIYEQQVYHGGRVPVASLPGVPIDLDALFA